MTVITYRLYATPETPVESAALVGRIHTAVHDLGIEYRVDVSPDVPSSTFARAAALFDPTAPLGLTESWALTRDGTLPAPAVLCTTVTVTTVGAAHEDGTVPATVTTSHPAGLGDAELNAARCVMRLLDDREERR